MNDQSDRGPVVIEIDTLPEHLDELATAPDWPDAASASRMARLAARRPSALLRWSLRFAAAVVMLVLGVWAWDFVFGLLARSPTLGWIAIALFGGLLLALAAVTLREVTAIARLARIESIRSEAATARDGADLEGARAVVGQLRRLMSGRGDAAWGLGRLDARAAEAVDAGDLLDLAERECLAPLDSRALAEIEASAARVATVTALVPLALADVATALYTNVSMIRRIAEIYGGRSGALGAWRLTRAVVAHLAATGAVAAGDDLIGSTLGGGVLSKLSRRFGEGLINGALTARVGITALDICRPLPFHAVKRPSVPATVRRALTGLFTQESST